MDPVQRHRITLSDHIVAAAVELGASAAGVAPVASLKRSPTYAAYDRDPYRESYQGVTWPEGSHSLLVFSLSHPRQEPDLDWWGPISGGTTGNSRLIRIANQMVGWLQREMNIKATPLPYQIEQGGVFLKDAAVLAGLGVMGRNNLLVTPNLGTSVRLRAMFLDAELKPTGPIPFAPCDGCPAPCLRACPQNAFDSGRYLRARCETQMDIDRGNQTSYRGALIDPLPYEVIKSCRACEFACPVGR